MFSTTTSTSHMAGAVAAVPNRQHTTRPMITGASVIGVVYDGGVLLAADTLLSYGSMAKVQNAERLRAIEGTYTVIGGAGEYSDFQEIVSMLEAKALEETCTSLMDSLENTSSRSPAAMTAEHVWNYLRMVMYRKRSKMNPYWNTILVAGTDMSTAKPFLGYVDKIGTTISDTCLATGFGAFMALPYLRDKWRPDLSEGEARALLEDCIKMLFYRDARSSAKMQLAKVEIHPITVGPPSVLVSDPYELDTSWDAAEYRKPSAMLDGDGGW